jgi:hypothetical protein
MGFAVQKWFHAMPCHAVVVVSDQPTLTWQDVALVGALLVFLGMKNSIPKRQGKKKAHKAKTN